MNNKTATNTEPEIELNDYGQPKRKPCPQPKFTFDEYVAECGPCGPDTPHGALWRELAVAAIKPEVALTPSTVSIQNFADGAPILFNPLSNKPRLSVERSRDDSVWLGKQMVVMLVVPEQRDTAVADVRRLIDDEDITEAAAWAFHEVGLCVFLVFGHEGWWNEAAARDLAMFRTGSEHIIQEVESAYKTHADG